MTFFRKKPAVVEAWQVEPFGQRRVPEWVAQAINASALVATREGLIVKVLDGLVAAQFGDWIIKNPDGTLSVATANTFARDYATLDQAAA